MKRILCVILLLVVMTLVAGCHVPLTEVDKQATNIEGIEVFEKDEIKEETGFEETKIESTPEPIMTATAKEESHEVLSLTVYYCDSDGTLVPVTRNIERQDGVAKAAVSTMIDNEYNREELKKWGLVPVLPEKTEILGINVVDGVATIDFNEGLLKYSNQHEECNIFSSIVYSLTEFETITDVKILVNGYAKEKLKYSGDISGVLNRNNILINSGRLNIDAKTMKFDVYLFKYLSDQYNYLTPVSNECIGITSELLPSELIADLSRNREGSLYTQLPENVELISSQIDEHVLTLDFNDKIKNYGGSTREEGIIKQILYSMKQIDGVEGILILIEGEKQELPEGTDISNVLTLTDKINLVE